ncbi:flagellar hook-basal body protein [Ramlibacter sp.]|uniref:flagellar hook-basal body protein n=1 Tax=Ramlibacter sp. TaxID=1917967 RepID=UPI003D128F8F
MIDALHIAATGMQAQQLHVEVIANNLSNLGTVGFKKSRVAFVDLVASETARAAATESAGMAIGSGVMRAGPGVGIAQVLRLFDAGELQQTGGVLDVALQGGAFIEVSGPDAARLFSRGGHLKVNTEGMLTTATGEVLRPGIAIPTDASNVKISPEGAVTFSQPGRRLPVEAGVLDFVRFADPTALQLAGDGLYRATAASGDAVPVRPGVDDATRVVQGKVEASNVRLTEEMIGLVAAQRAYAVNTKVLQAADEMLGMINTLRK